MRDMDRAELTKAVYNKLTESRFRERLTATAPDGSRPITVALREDSIRSLLERIELVGGSSNVVVPTLNGFVVISVVGESGRKRSTDQRPDVLNGHCTVGVFMERLRLDGPHGEAVTYLFEVKDRAQKTERGRAELVAVG
jgi:hypothetical protein